jgi:hypothetical protein
MTTSRTDPVLASAPRLVRIYLGFFCIVLAGYAVFGREFAYLGFPPLYIGEIALVLGIAVALMAGHLTSAILNLPGLTLALLMLWTAHRTVPYWDQYGFDAPRDAMIVFYGLFAYVIASLIGQRPSTLLFLVERYKHFIFYAVFLAPIIFTVGHTFPPLLGIGPNAAELACHMTAIFAFALIGFVRLRPLALIVMMLFELFAFSQAREAMVVFVLCSSLAAAFSLESRVLRHISAGIGICAAVVGVLFVVDFHFDSEDLRRPVSVRQYMENVSTIFADSDDETKEWRLNWWSDITNYTVHGPYFWTGKGFGPNLADTDGYQTSGPDEAPLRSPHNAHMTILARGGVPGLALWILALGAWLGAMLRQLVEARRLRDSWWASIFAILVVYWTAILVASSFAVVLEGPVMGIWFWTIHGIGMASLILHRHRVAMLLAPRWAAHAPFAG